MMAHTPGPWSVTPTPTDEHHTHKIMYDCVQDHRRIGAVCGVFSKDDGESAANARLIAAAPEMLKQLRAVRDDIGALACDTNGWREWDATAVDELLGSRLVRLDDLIAKAEGGK
jgi:hypothetical protein